MKKHFVIVGLLTGLVGLSGAVASAQVSDQKDSTEQKVPSTSVTPPTSANEQQAPPASVTPPAPAKEQQAPAAVKASTDEDARYDAVVAKGTKETPESIRIWNMPELHPFVVEVGKTYKIKSRNERTYVLDTNRGDRDFYHWGTGSEETPLPGENVERNEITIQDSQKHQGLYTKDELLKILPVGHKLENFKKVTQKMGDITIDFAEVDTPITSPPEKIGQIRKGYVGFEYLKDIKPHPKSKA